MSEAIELLGRLEARFLLFGSRALMLHGFDLKRNDIDVWLDPHLNDERWRGGIIRAAGSLEPQFRHNPDVSPPERYARVLTTPHVDFMSRPSGYLQSDFDAIYADSFQTPVGRIPKIKVILRSKMHASRPKDYRHTMQAAREILNLW